MVDMGKRTGQNIQLQAGRIHPRLVCDLGRGATFEEIPLSELAAASLVSKAQFSSEFVEVGLAAGQCDLLESTGWSELRPAVSGAQC